MRAVAKFAVLTALVLSMPALLATCAGGGDKSGSTSAGHARQDARPGARSEYLNDGDSETNHDGDLDDESPSREDHDADSSHEYTKIRENRFYHDSDDYEEGALSTGRPATVVEQRPIAALVERYLKAAASIDAATGCSLLLRRVVRTLPSEFGRKGGPAYTRGANSCNTVLTSLFRHYRSELRARWVVTGVRIANFSAAALLGSHRAPASTMTLSREGDRWRVESLIPLALP